MPRPSLLSSLCLALLWCIALPAQNGAVPPPSEHEHVFGTDGAGFRVLFTRAGAMVKHVHLIDHRAEVENPDHSRDEYLLADVLWADPLQPGLGWLAWLGLGEWQKDQRRLACDPATVTWDLAADETDRVRFTLDCGEGLVLEKSFSYQPGRRDLLLEITLRATAAHPRAGEDLMLRLTGLAVRSPRSEYTLGQNVAVAIGATTPDGKATSVHAEHADGKPNLERMPVVVAAEGSARIVFAGSTNRFFGAFLYPADEPSSSGLWVTQVRKLPMVEQADTPAFTLPVPEYGLRVRIPEIGQEAKLAYRLYLGPKSKRVFATNPDYERFDGVVNHDLAPGCFCEIPGARRVAQFLLWLLGILHDVIGNWGLAIVVLTILVRGALVPLNFRMQKSMRAYGAKASKLKPKLDAIQKKYTNDKKALQRAMVEFQREHKMIPPLGGCLPMFVTIPVFIGLFSALRTSYDLRQQPFISWLGDLSQPDALFDLPFAWLPHFNLLPILMVGLWWWLQSSTPLPSDPQQRQMMKIMRFMPLMFGVMLYNYASGLMVYMITSSLFALVEQRIVRNVLGPMSPEAAAFATPQI